MASSLSAQLRGSAHPLQRPAHELDAARDNERDREREQQSLPGGVLERPAAEVAEQRGVQSPAERRRGVEEEEASPRIPERARAERDRGTAAGDEPSDRDQLAAARVELLLGPANAATGLLAAEKALRETTAEAAAHEGWGVVAG